MFLNYAHRGASGYFPENTMLAFEKAVELGCDGIETDVQLTKDGVMVLIHDEKVDRTTDESGFVKDFSYKELRKLDAGSFMNEKFKDLKIPSCEELLEFAKCRDIQINFELKNGLIDYKGLEEKLIETIYRYGMESKVIISSFNHYSIRHCKEVDPDIKTGILYIAGLYKPENYCRQVGADAIHPLFNTLNDEIINAAIKSGIMINTFTVNEASDMKRLIDAKVTGIITNYPDKLNNFR